MCTNFLSFFTELRFSNSLWSHIGQLRLTWNPFEVSRKPANLITLIRLFYVRNMSSSFNLKNMVKFGLWNRFRIFLFARKLILRHIKLTEIERYSQHDLIIDKD
uniref:(northern house mosquito) hypothetical protein n=1 Tax=Culex pipiens TaxID=7175 RepID=A0A8D8CII4_CULPI